MSAGRWDEIKYPEVPSRAMMIYRKAFEKHDADRYNAFIKKAAAGETKINSSTLFPYDLVEKVWPQSMWHVGPAHEDATVEAQWRQLPNYVEPGSMCGRPMATSVGLAIYFAERNTGAYHNLWMSFSCYPRMHVLKGDTLAQKISNLDMRDWQQNTDLKAAFELVLSIAVNNHINPDEMPKSLIVISDMEIDYCGNRDWTFYEQMSASFSERGYQIPNIIFWNVNSRHDIFHADSKRLGVQLCSGQSTTVFKQMLACVGMTPVEAMEKVINSDRYNCITVG